MLLSNTTFPFLAEPLPDEILPSVIFRSAEMMGMSNYVYLNQTKGSDFRSLFYYPFLNSFADIEGVLKMTVYPYYFSTMDEKRRKEALDRIRNGESVGPLFPSYPAPGLKKRKFYYCPECLDSDLRKYGTGYFRLSHQHEGVNCCIEHKTKLVVCGKALSEIRLGKEDLVRPLKATDLDVEEALLIRTVSQMSYKELSGCYKATLDFMGGSRQSNKAMIMENCKRIPMNYEVSMNTHRYKCLLGEGYKSCHPYFHVMMIKALAIERGSPEKVLSQPTKQCRNPYCASHNTRLMGSNYCEFDYWKCEDCGMVYTPVKILQLGKNGKKLIEEQVNVKGMSRKRMAKELGIAWDSYKKLMDGNPEKVDKEIGENRRKADNYNGRMEMKEKDCKAYKFLRRFDGEWFKQKFPSVSTGTKKPQMSEEAVRNRDAQTLEKVKSAFEEAKRKDVWISKNYLKKAAGVRQDNDYMKQYFPETLKFIEENGETKEAYWIRRVKLFVDSYPFDKPLTPQVLKKELGTSPYIQTAYRLLENYIKAKEREAE